MQNFSIRYLKYTLFIAILLLAYSLRFFKLSSIPPGLYIDEASSLYNAYSILKTRYDEHGVYLPLWFKAFGEYKLPIYIYTTSFFIWLVGLNEMAIRITSALSGVFMAATSYFLTQLLLTFFVENRKHFHTLPLLTSFFIAISPWNIHFSRGGFEATLALFLITLGVLFYLLSLQEKKSFLLSISSVAFILSLYTYNAERLITPVVVLVLLLFTYQKLLDRSKVSLVVICISSIILLIPFIRYAISPEGLVRFSSERFGGDVSFDYLDSIWDIAKSFGTLWTKGYSSYFSFDYLFFLGDQAGRHSVREMGLFYLWQLPFLLLGIYLSIKKQRILGIFILLLLLASPFSASLVRPSPHALRSLPMTVPAILFISFALSYLLMRKGRFSIIYILFIVLVCSYGLFTYLHIYYIHYPKRTAVDWQDGYKQMVLATKKYLDNTDSIFISRNKDYPYLYALLFLPYDPQQYLLEKGSPDHFGKYYFVDSPYNAVPPKNSLYIAQPWEKPIGQNLEDIYLFNGDKAYTIWKN